MMIGVGSKEYVSSRGTVHDFLPATGKGNVNVLYWECGLERECRWQDSGKEWIRGSAGEVVGCGFSLILKGID